MDLTEIGLTPNEAKVYESLLKFGKSTAAQICKDANVPYGRIYTILASLEAKGLAKTLPEKTKKFVPSDPKAIEDFIIQKKNVLDEMEKKIKEFKTIYQEHKEEPIQLAQGKQAFFKMLHSMKSAEVYEYAIKYNFTTNPSVIRGMTSLKKRGADYKTLGRIDKETKKNVNIIKKINANIKSIPNEGVAISIKDDEQILISLIKSNTTMLIRDAPFVKLMKELFLNYYEHQKQIN